MKTAILVVIILLILGLAAFYVIRSKKKGTKCIGCPYGRTCCDKKKNGDITPCSSCNPGEKQY